MVTKDWGAEEEACRRLPDEDYLTLCAKGHAMYEASQVYAAEADGTFNSFAGERDAVLTADIGHEG